MAIPIITSLRFLPPVAVARVGDSDQPLEAFTWEEDTRPFGASQTIIAPRVSLEVLPDGSVEPYLPGAIRFRDGLSVRPVCPFLELWATVGVGRAKKTVPLTSRLLEKAGMELSALQFSITAANLKGQRQTNNPACGFEARLEVRADDFTRHDLWAWTHSPADQPLVLKERPIWLGAVQSIRPRRSRRLGVALDRVRIRFTPGRGAVYGPPSAISGFLSGNRAAFEIVPSQNRILNQQSPWCSYDNTKVPYSYTMPKDVYDGNSDVDRDPLGWGVVDDCCDAVISASLPTLLSAEGSFSPTAKARVLVGPPHYSPDRRHLFSFADDLADRNPDTLCERGREIDKCTPAEWLEMIVDLFTRAWETGSQINLERQRNGNLQENADRGFSNLPGFPEIGQKSMTSEDKSGGEDLMSFRFLALTEGDQGDAANKVPLLAQSEQAKARHAQLAVPKILVEYLIRYPERVKEIVRPPFRRLSDKPIPEKDLKPSDFRDPKLGRSYAFDARMPPFLRDADFSPLSLSRRQYDLLMGKLDDAAFMTAVYKALEK